MPKAGAHHVLNGSLLAIGKFDFGLLNTLTWPLSAFSTWFLRTFAGAFTAFFTWLWRVFNADAGVTIALLAWFGFLRLTIPFGITEMMVSFYKIIDSKIIFALIQSGAASNDLLKLNHRVDGTH